MLQAVSFVRRPALITRQPAPAPSPALSATPLADARPQWADWDGALLPRTFRPTEFRIKWATQNWERLGAHALRRDVFCEEQSLFEQDDRDATDDHAHLLVAMTCLGGTPDEIVGTVRIHRDEEDRWWGSRLAVHRDFRKEGSLGACLIRLAVSSATALGCHTFLAHVQRQNVPLFRRLHWDVEGEVTVQGIAHARMRAQLEAYPPMTDMQNGFVARGRGR